MVHSLTIYLKQIIEIIKKQYIVYLDYVFYFKSRSLMVRWVVGSIPHGGPIELFLVTASVSIPTEKNLHRKSTNVSGVIISVFTFRSVAIESAITPPAPGFN